MNKKITILYITILIVAVLSSLITQSKIVGDIMSIVLFATIIAIMYTPDNFDRAEKHQQ